MTLLYPLGLLALISLVVLFIIYIIRPNFQQKFISSTYVWKLSLKYRKKKIPISKLRNILLIICQVLILTACSLILTQPNEILKTPETATEVIAIIDSSASMRTLKGKVSRFKRAVSDAEYLVQETIEDGGIASIILADRQPSVLVSRATLKDETTIDSALAPLKNEDFCSYGESDIDGAIAMTKEILLENPDAKIYLYTDIKYSNVPKGITVMKVSDDEEWNAAILDVRVEKQENYCTFYVDVACYGQPRDIAVSLFAQGVNTTANSVGADSTVELVERAFCPLGKVKTFMFVYEGIYEEDTSEEDVIPSLIPEAKKIYSYETVNISIDAADSYRGDNSFNLYDGKKDLLRIQYASTEPNPFFPNVLSIIELAYEDVWDIEITEVKKDGEYATNGFDLYIFEHFLPEKMPMDGVVFFMDPTRESDVPAGAGFVLGNTFNIGEDVFFMPQDDAHPLLKNVNTGNITTQKVTQITYDKSYQLVADCKNGVTILARNEKDVKTVVMPFDLHYSNLAVLKEFPILMYNMIDYFFPVTVRGNVFEVYETIALNTRGDSLKVERGTTSVESFPNETYPQFPVKLEVDLPGTYVLKQITTLGNLAIENKIFVRLPVSESDICKTVETLPNPYVEKKDEDYLKDLLLYLAAGLVTVLFLEWILHLRENG